MSNKRIIEDWMLLEAKNNDLDSVEELAERAVVHFELYSASVNSKHWIYHKAQQVYQDIYGVYDTPGVD